MKTMIHPESAVENPIIARTTIAIPTEGLDGREISDFMDFQQRVIADDECHGMVHTTMDAPDHPNRTQIELAYLEEGHDDVSPRSTVSHTIANTKDGLPELIVVGADAQSATCLMIEVMDAMRSEEGLQIGVPVLVGRRLLQIQPIEFRALSSFRDAFVSFVATQVLSCQFGTPPTWMQIVYADGNHRFPWEPGADPDIYQPIADRRMAKTFAGRGTADV